MGAISYHSDSRQAAEIAEARAENERLKHEAKNATIQLVSLREAKETLTKNCTKDILDLKEQLAKAQRSNQRAELKCIIFKYGYMEDFDILIKILHEKTAIPYYNIEVWFEENGFWNPDDEGESLIDMLIEQGVTG